MTRRAALSLFAIITLANVAPVFAASNDNFVSYPAKVVVKFAVLPFKVVSRTLGVGKSK
jgi:hypothetical protein